MKQLIYICSFLLILISCKTAEEVKSDIAPTEKRYALGQGGGFTGEYIEYVLGESGRVYKYDFKYDREVFYKELSKEDLSYFMEKIGTLGLEGIDINQPGNITYYIEVRANKTSLNKISWGANLYYPPNELVNLHKELLDKLKQLD